MSFILLGILNSQVSGGAGIGGPYWIMETNYINRNVYTEDIAVDPDGSVYVFSEMQAPNSTYRYRPILEKFDIDMNELWQAGFYNTLFSGDADMYGRKMTLIDDGTGKLNPIIVSETYINSTYTSNGYLHKLDANTGSLLAERTRLGSRFQGTGALETLTDNSAAFVAGYWRTTGGTNEWSVWRIDNALGTSTLPGIKGGASYARRLSIVGNDLYIGGDEGVYDRIQKRTYDAATPSINKVWDNRHTSTSEVYDGFVANGSIGLAYHGNLSPARWDTFDLSTGARGAGYGMPSGWSVNQATTDVDGNIIVLYRGPSTPTKLVLVKYDPTFTTVEWARDIQHSTDNLSARYLRTDISGNIYIPMSVFNSTLGTEDGVSIKLPADGSVTGSVVLGSGTWTVSNGSAPTFSAQSAPSYTTVNYSETNINNFGTNTFGTWTPPTTNTIGTL